jgi:SSS family solute:Na+ symporter
MQALDWVIVGGYFLVMIGIGLWAKARVKDSADYFTAAT